MGKIIRELNPYTGKYEEHEANCSINHVPSVGWSPIGEHYHPDPFDRSALGQEHETMGDYKYRRAGEVIPGDAVFLRNESKVVTGVRHHDRGVTVTTQSRTHHVEKNVISRMQFGVPGITMEEPNDEAHTFHPEQVVPVRQ